MKRLFIFAFICFPFSTGTAFWSNSSIQKSKMTIQAQIETQSSHFEISYEIQNTTEKTASFQFLYPLSESANTIHLYKEMEGVPFTLIKKEERTDFIATAVQEKKDIRFFNLHRQEYPILLKSEFIEIQSQESITLKIQWNQKNTTHDDFILSQFFTNDQIPGNTTIEVHIKNDKSIEQFYTNNPLKQTEELEKNEFIQIGNAENFYFYDNVFFLFSGISNAHISSQGLNHSYQAKFLKKTQAPPPEYITFLLDRTGSMNDGSWDRTTEWIRFLLDNFNTHQKIKIGLMGKEVQWYNDEFKTNTFEFKKEFFQFIESVSPIGSMDIETQLIEAQQNIPEEKSLVFFFTNEDAPTKSIETMPFIVFFTDEERQSGWDNFTEKNKGFAIRLFKGTLGTPEEKQWRHLWRNWNTEFEDKRIRSTKLQFPFFVEKLENKSTPHSFDFIQKKWATQFLKKKIQEEKKEPQQREVEIQAISRIFGIQSDTIHHESSLHDIQKMIQNTDLKTLENTQFKTQAETTETERYKNKKPIYKHSNNRWQVFDFHQQNDPLTLIQIAPYSEAQKEIFKRFPDESALFFSISQEVDFCIPYRCISVTKNGRETPLLSDTAFWKENHNPHHWANPYLKKAVQKELITPDESGALNEDSPISRGEFVQIITDYFFPNTKSTQKYEWSDVSKESDLQNTLQVLREKNIIQGYPDQTFKPEKKLSRAEGIKIVLSSIGFAPKEEENESPIEPHFEDSKGWEKLWVNEGFKRKIIQGRSESKFDPHGLLTRAEALKIIFVAAEERE